MSDGKSRGEVWLARITVVVIGLVLALMLLAASEVRFISPEPAKTSPPSAMEEEKKETEKPKGVPKQSEPRS
jgi:hypothetical protein